jgi:hypothetical protein
MAIRRHYINDAAVVQLTGGISNVDVTCVVSDPSTFPASFPWTAVIDSGLGTAEIVLVTAASGSTLTITRGYDGTSAQAHTTGARFAHAAVKADYDEANSHVTSSAGVHGVVGSVVGTSDTQTLTNKTLTSPSVTNPTITAPTITGTTSITGATTVTGSLHVTTTSLLSGAVTYGDDTGWHDLVLGSGWTVAGGSVAQCRRKDGVVWFRGQVSNSSFSGGTGAPVTFATMPVDGSSNPIVPYPLYPVEVAANGNTPFVRTVSVLADGTVRMFAEASSSTAFGLSGISYLTD